jgi:hypothetical protein
LTPTADANRIANPVSGWRQANITRTSTWYSKWMSAPSFPADSEQGGGELWIRHSKVRILPPQPPVGVWLATSRSPARAVATQDPVLRGLLLGNGQVVEGILFPGTDRGQASRHLGLPRLARLPGGRTALSSRPDIFGLCRRASPVITVPSDHPSSTVGAGCVWQQARAS